jgi:hypothetical protein
MRKKDEVDDANAARYKDSNLPPLLRALIRHAKMARNRLVDGTEIRPIWINHRLTARTLAGCKAELERALHKHRSDPRARNEGQKRKRGPIPAP